MTQIWTYITLLLSVIVETSSEIIVPVFMYENVSSYVLHSFGYKGLTGPQWGHKIGRAFAGLRDKQPGAIDDKIRELKTLLQ